MPTRRKFLTRAIAAGSAMAFSAPRPGAGAQRSVNSKALRVLILGGTGNIGPYHVRAAVERGHRVSVFSRGHVRANLPPGVEYLLGDRNHDLNTIQGRDWDAVIDIATFGPAWVRTLGEALKGRVGHYTFISTISVYDNPAANPITDETSPVLAYHGTADPYSPVSAEGADYGALKVLCEREADRQFPGRANIVRAGYIAGPDDTHASFPYWLLRMQRGGECLAAGDPSTSVQYIDVRDLAEWIVRMIEKHGTGTYNAVGPTPSANLAEVINFARQTAVPPPEVTWVTRSWLSTQKDAALFGGLLFWEINKGSLTGISNARALAQGLMTRSVRTTLADTLQWIRKQPPQTDVLAGFRPKPDHTGFEPVRLPWPVYLEREKALLSAWHAQERKS